MINVHKKKIDTKYIVLIIIGIIILLLTIFSFIIKDKRDLSAPERFLKDIFISVENVVLFPFRFISDEIEEFINLKDVYEENKVLKSNLDRYDLLYTQNQELKRQIEELKEEYGVETVLSEYEYIKSTVINRNLNYWYDTITIDKGTKAGITKDMAVITSKGLIGKIIKVKKNTSEVKLITSSNSNNKISVIVETPNNTRLYGILTDYDNNKNTLSIEGISDNSTIDKGSKVYTSGLNDIFPSGILIGEVKNEKKDNYGLSKVVYVTPSNDMSDITYVTVLKRKN